MSSRVPARPGRASAAASHLSGTRPTRYTRAAPSAPPVTFLIVPSRGLLGRSVRYDLLPLSYA